jgi:hypothetical protein
LAKVEAVFFDKNKLTISTQSANQLQLQLQGHPKFSAKKLLEIEIDGYQLAERTDGSLLLERTAQGWSITSSSAKTASISQKQAHQEGPLFDALSSRHIYVYGTADNPDAATLEQRKLAAQKAADWSFYRGEFLGRIMAFPRVLRDQDLRESDYASSNLILLGNAQTNSVIAQLAPFDLASEQSDLGLAYVFPHRDHYILVNSGLSLMDAPEPEGVFISGLSRYTTPPFLLKSKLFKDLVVFSKEKVLLNTHFDQHWGLSREQAQELDRLSVKKLFIK